MRQIELTQGKVALVDDEDFERIVAYGKWYAYCSRGKWYGRRNSKPQGRAVHLHKEILQVKASRVDHIDGDSLNCQKKNLRVATQAQNARNRKINKSNTVGYKGVSFTLSNGGPRRVYVARISIRKRRIFLGQFATAELAAEAYNKAAFIHHGEFASLNKIGNKK